MRTFFMNRSIAATPGSRLRRALGVLALASAWAASIPAWAQSAPGGTVSTGAISTLTSPIGVGSTQVDITLPVSGMTSLRVQAIVPVPGATVSLIAPNGVVVIAPNDPALSYLGGQSLSPPLPGGVYITPEVANPANGNWVLRAQFPPAPTRTVALLTLFATTPYQVGVVLTGQSFHVGQPVPLGLLIVNNGLPITGLQPTLKISKNGITVASLGLLDSGRPGDYDGLANDGIYSAGNVFTELGRYVIEGNVTIPVAGGSITRTAASFVDIAPNNYALNNVVGGFSSGTGGCVSQLRVTANATAQQAGTFSTAATLKSPDGTTFVKRTNSVLTTPGTFDATVSFTSREIRSRFAQGGVFTIDPLEVVSVVNDQVTLEARRAAAYVFPNFPITQFCSDPIEIGLSAAVSPVLRANFIGSLNFRLPMSVTTAGNYAVSFKVSDSQGKEVGQFAVNKFLAAGIVNNIDSTVLADRLQTADGPFSVESVLVVGAGTSAQASRVPVAASTLSRWQFFPTITADLNADGSVDAIDRDLLLSYRNAAPLVPGDRRDLNGDGKIDLIDARLLILRACRAPNCPRN